MLKHIEKLEKGLFYIFLFSIPLQTRLILFSWSVMFNEWIAGFLYWTDIALIGLFYLWLGRALRDSLKPRLSRVDLYIIVFFIISAVSIINSSIISLSFYRLIKLLEFLGLYFYIKSNLKLISIPASSLIIFISGLFQSVIAILQFAGQKSLGFHILGESVLNLKLKGVAAFFVEGQKYMRSYGTTPHPNVLAGWLLLSFFAFYLWFFWTDRSKNIRDTFWLLVPYSIMLIAFFLTFSRVIIGLYFLCIIILTVGFWYKRKFSNLSVNLKGPIVLMISTTVAVTLIFSVILWPLVRSRLQISMQDSAVTERLQYNELAGAEIKRKPILGVGIGQFVSSLKITQKTFPSYFFQPVHNIYLLILAEVGVIGFLLFVLFISSILYAIYVKSRFRKPEQIAIFSVLFLFLAIGLFDHFLWTLQQGSLMFWMLLGFSARNY